MAGEYSVGGLALISNATRASQRSKILGLLVSARGDWVPLPKIVELASQYNARLYELRRLGFRIANKMREVDGVRRSWFRLESTPSAVHDSQTEATPGATANSFPEFGSLAPEKYGVD
jgi:hypothetical protein